MDKLRNKLIQKFCLGDGKWSQWEPWSKCNQVYGFLKVESRLSFEFQNCVSHPDTGQVMTQARRERRRYVNYFHKVYSKCVKFLKM